MAIPVQDYSQLRDKECPICLTVMTRAVQLPCSHAICQSCLHDLRQFGCVCPLCRSHLPCHPHELFKDACRLGCRADRSKDKKLSDSLWAEAIRLLESAAGQGHEGSMFILILCYTEGKGTPINHQRAVVMWEAAAEKGNPEAQYGLGLCYQVGNGVEKNNERAADLWTQASIQGHAEAQVCLSECYQKGMGRPIDTERTVQLLKSASEQGHTGAMIALGDCYVKAAGVESNDELAFEFYQDAAKLNNPHAIRMLGWCYARGQGTECDPPHAAKCYKQALELGHVDATWRAGICYMRGHGVEENHLCGTKLIKLAAKLGHPDAITHMNIVRTEFDVAPGAEFDIADYIEFYDRVKPKVNEYSKIVDKLLLKLPTHALPANASPKPSLSVDFCVQVGLCTDMIESSLSL